MENNDDSKYLWDVIIVGGGPAGSSSAITMAKQGCKILVLEKSPTYKFKFGESLSPSSLGIVRNYLDENDAFDPSEQCIEKSFGNISTWGSDQQNINDFFFTQNGYGITINRNNFECKLRDIALRTGVSFDIGSKFMACHRVDENDRYYALGYKWRVEIKVDNQTIEKYCKYIIDCSGRSSVVAKSIGVQKEKNDHLFAYAQIYISKNSEEECNFTRVEATENGWWYTNVMPFYHESYKARIVVFHTDLRMKFSKYLCKNEYFEKEFTSTSDIAPFLKEYDYVPEGKVLGTSACSERLERYLGDHWVAIGDAAQAYDPLSSQGIHRALQSGKAVGDGIVLSLHDLSVTDNYLLDSYEQEQQAWWQEYTKLRTEYYASEARWRDCDFWRLQSKLAPDPAQL